MSTVYLDTSALGRVLLGQPDAPAIRAAVGRFDRQVASRLLRVELRRVALRHGALHDADLLLAGVALIEIDDATLSRVETVGPPTVGTLDAIHLVTALRLTEDGQMDALMTYDAQLAAGARHHGLTVLAPA